MLSNLFQKLSGSVAWNRAKFALRDQPLSTVTAFALLHEVTAIAPLPVFYWIFEHYDVLGEGSSQYIPKTWTEEGERRMTKLLGYFGKEDVADSVAWSRTLGHATMSYIAVKFLMPLRVALSLYCAPAFGARIAKFSKLLRRVKVPRQA